MEKRTRREFFIDSANIAAVALCVSAMGYDLLWPQDSQALSDKFPVSSCGIDNKNGQKVLIAYDSQCGSTGEVAVTIGKALCKSGAMVDTKYVKSVQALDDYSAVIIGSAIHREQFMPEATDFVISNKHVLCNLPVAYFFTCLTLAEDSEGARRKAGTFLDSLNAQAPQVKAVSVGRFAGVLDYSKLSFMYRTVMKRKMKKRGIQEGDYRDWDAIRSWAAETYVKLC